MPPPRAPLDAATRARLEAETSAALAKVGLGPSESREAFFRALRLHPGDGKPVMPNDLREAERMHGDELPVEEGEWYDGIPGAEGTRRIAATDAARALDDDDDEGGGGDGDDGLHEERIADGETGSGFCLESPRMAKLDNFVDDESGEASALPPWIANATEATYPGEAVANAAAADARAALGDEDEDESENETEPSRPVHALDEDIDEESHAYTKDGDVSSAPAPPAPPAPTVESGPAAEPDAVDAVEDFALDPSFDYDNVKLTPKHLVTRDPATWR